MAQLKWIKSIFFCFLVWKIESYLFSVRRAAQSEGRCICVESVSQTEIWSRWEQITTDRQVNSGISRWKDTVWGLFRLYSSEFCYRLQASLILCVFAAWMCEYVRGTQIKGVRGWGRLLWHLEASAGWGAHLFIDKDRRRTNTSHYIVNPDEPLSSYNTVQQVWLQRELSYIILCAQLDDFI